MPSSPVDFLITIQKSQTRDETLTAVPPCFSEIIMSLPPPPTHTHTHTVAVSLYMYLNPRKAFILQTPAGHEAFVSRATSTNIFTFPSRGEVSCCDKAWEK